MALKLHKHILFMFFIFWAKIVISTNDLFVYNQIFKSATAFKYQNSIRGVDYFGIVRDN